MNVKDKHMGPSFIPSDLCLDTHATQLSWTGVIFRFLHPYRGGELEYWPAETVLRWSENPLPRIPRYFRVYYYIHSAFLIKYTQSEIVIIHIKIKTHSHRQSNTYCKLPTIRTSRTTPLTFLNFMLNNFLQHLPPLWYTSVY